MAPVIPTVEPTTITAGSTVKWKASSATYPVSEGWALSYALNGASTLLWDTGYVTNDGSTHTVTLSATVTGTLTPGTYTLTRIWTLSGEVYREELSPVLVVANPATQGPGDALAFAERNLAYVEAAITARLHDDQPEEYEIGGRSVTKMKVAELRKIRGELRAEVWKLRNPGQSHRSTFVRFTVPT